MLQHGCIYETVDVVLVSKRHFYDETVLWLQGTYCDIEYYRFTKVWMEIAGLKMRLLLAELREVFNFDFRF